eukprot:3973648-Lingulodinium_polyedra.AAC.1
MCIRDRAWAVGCACCPPRGSADRWKLVLDMLRLEGNDLLAEEAGCGHPCPMAGRRAPEMASG